MRVFLAATLLVPQLVAADLYRWVDPQSGSVKFSSAPPPWYETERGPKVERIPYQGPAAKSAGPEKPAAGGSTFAALEARWRSLQQALSELPQKQDFERGGQAIQQQLQAYEALRAELDRLDPAGAARRRAENSTFLEKLSKGLEAQFSPRPAAQK